MDGEGLKQYNLLHSIRHHHAKIVVTHIKKQWATCVHINCYYYCFSCYTYLILNAKATFFIFHHFSIIFHFSGIWKPTRFPAVRAAYLALCWILSTQRTPLRALRNILSFCSLRSHLRGHIIISLHDTGIQEEDTSTVFIFFKHIRYHGDIPPPHNYKLPECIEKYTKN